MPLDFSSEFGLSFGSEPELKKDDFSSARGIVGGETWVSMSPEEREASYESGFNRIKNYYEEDKSRKVTVTLPDGNQKEMSLWYPDGSGLSAFGVEFFQKQLEALEIAAKVPTGGVDRNVYTGEIEIEPMLSGYFSDEYTPPYHRKKNMGDYYADAVKEMDGLMDGDKPARLTFEKFVEYVNKELPEGSEGELDVDNENLRERFNSFEKLVNFNPKTLGDKYIGEVEGVPQINPEKLSDHQGMLSAIDGLEISQGEKYLLKDQYRKLVNLAGQKLLEEAGYAEGMESYGVVGPATPFLKYIGGELKDAVGMERNDLFSKYVRHAGREEGPTDFYSFMVENAEMFDEDRYGIGDKLTASLYKAFASTGIGLLQLGSAYQFEWANKASINVNEVVDGAYEGMGADWEYHGPAGIHLTEKGIYDMAGQVISILGTGGATGIAQAGIKGVALKGGAYASGSTTSRLLGKGLTTWGDDTIRGYRGAFLKGTAKAGAGLGGSMVGGAALGEVGEMVGGDKGRMIGGVAGSLIGGGVGIGSAGKIGTTAKTITEKGVSGLKGSQWKMEYGRRLAIAGEMAQKRAKELAPNTFKNLAIKAVTDPSAYIGALQAGGMSYGAVFNQVYEATGDRELAAKQAWIRGLSDTASAFVATAVFNRIAAGAEGRMAGLSAFSGNLASARGRSQFISLLEGKAGQDAFKATLASLAGDGQTAKLLGQGIKEVIKREASNIGLKRYLPVVGGVAVETVEETVDTMLSDVFTAVLHRANDVDVKVYTSVQAKIGEYLSAGIMGAFGGGLGGTITIPVDYFKSNSKERQAYIERQARLVWDKIEGKFESFEPNVEQAVRSSGVKQGDLTVAEYLANSTDSPKKKAQVLLETVMAPITKVDMADAVNKGAKKARDEDDKEIDAAEPSDAEGVDLAAMGYEAPKGRKLIANPTTQLQTDKKGNVIEADAGDQGTLSPLMIEGVPYAGARLTKPDGTKVDVSAKKAAEILAATKGDSKEQNKYETAVDELTLKTKLTQSDTGSDTAGKRGPSTPGDAGKAGKQSAKKTSDQSDAGATQPKQAQGQQATSPAQRGVKVEVNEKVPELTSEKLSKMDKSLKAPILKDAALGEDKTVNRGKATPKQKIQAEYIARRAAAIVTKLFPTLKGRIYRYKGEDSVTGGAAANVGSDGKSILLVTPTDIAELLRKGFTPEQALQMVVKTLVSEEVIHQLQFDSAGRQKGNKNSYEAAKELYQELYNDLKESNPELLEKAKELYGENMQSMSEWLQAMEAVRMIVELALEGKTTELNKILGTIKNKKILDRIASIVKSMIELLRTGKLPESVSFEVDNLVKLYNNLIKESETASAKKEEDEFAEFDEIIDELQRAEDIKALNALDKESLEKVDDMKAPGLKRLPAPRPKPKKRMGKKPLPPVDTIEIPARKIADEVETTLTEEEKQSAAKDLGETEWNSKARKSFVEAFADWVVSGVAKTKNLAKLFKKLVKSITVAGITAYAAISPVNNTAPIQRVNIESNEFSPQEIEIIQNIDPIIENNIEPSKLDEFVFPTQVQKIAVADDTTLGDTPDVTAPAMPEMRDAPSPILPNFNNLPHSRNAYAVAAWVLKNGDNKGKPFAIADKSGAAVYFFDANGSLMARGPALYGKAFGDFVPTDRSNREALKVTPSGRFEMNVVPSTDPLYSPAWIDFAQLGPKWMVAIHKTYLGNPSQKRNERLKSETTQDNKISAGCINIDKKLLEEVLPVFDQGGPLYVTPETKAGKDAFEGFENVNIDEASTGLIALLGLLAAAGRRAKSRRTSRQEFADEAAKIIASNTEVTTEEAEYASRLIEDKIDEVWSKLESEEAQDSKAEEEKGFVQEEDTNHEPFDNAFPQNEVEYNDDSHEYRIDGEEHTPVSTKMKEIPGVEYTGPNFRDAADTGTKVHDELSALLKNPDASVPPKYEEIIDTIRSVAGKSGVVLSEVVVWSNGVAGRVDVMVQDSKGKYHLFDFKTSASNPHDNTAYKRSTDDSLSTFDKHRLQMAMYGRMIEQKMGIKIASYQIVPINSKTGKLWKKDNQRFINAQPDAQTTQRVDQLLGAFEAQPQVAPEPKPEAKPKPEPEAEEQPQVKPKKENDSDQLATDKSIFEKDFADLTEEESERIDNLIAENRKNDPQAFGLLQNFTRQNPNEARKNVEILYNRTLENDATEVDVAMYAYARKLLVDKKLPDVVPDSVGTAPPTSLKALDPTASHKSTSPKRREIIIQPKVVDGQEKDKIGGTWSKEEVPGSESIDTNRKKTVQYRFVYTPAEGTFVNPSEFDVVQVEKTDRVLLLENFAEGKLTFREINVSKNITDPVLAKRLDSRSRNWEASLLTLIKKELEEFMPSLLTPNAAGKFTTISDKQFDAVFMKVLRLVAPNMPADAVKAAELSTGYIEVRDTPTPYKGKSPNDALTFDELMNNSKAKLEEAEKQLSLIAKEEERTEEVEAVKELVRNKEAMEAQLAQAKQEIADLNKYAETTKRFVMTPTLLVDRKKFVDRMRGIFGAYSLSDDAYYNNIMAMEVGRQMARIIDEEMIHYLAMPNFTQAELEKFLEEGLSGDKRVAIVRAKILQTMGQRMPEKTYDELNEQEKYILAHEVIRKLTQYTTSGVTTEQQYLDSRVIANMVRMNSKDKKVKKISTVIGLLKRYWNNLRNALGMRQAKSRLTAHQRAMLNRMDNLIAEAGMRSDIDAISDAAYDENSFDLAEAKQNLDNRIQELSREKDIFTDLSLLKEKIRDLKTADIESTVILDYDTGKLSLSEDFLELLKITEPEYDTDSLQEAIGYLNEINTGRDAIVLMILAEQKLNAARQILPEAPAPGDTRGFAMTESERANEVLSRMKKRMDKTSKFNELDVNVVAELLNNKVKPDEDQIAEVEKSFARARAKIDREIDDKLVVEDELALQKIEKLDLSNSADIRVLLNTAKRMDIIGEEIDTPEGLIALRQEVVNQMRYVRIAEDSYESRLFAPGTISDYVNPAKSKEIDELTRASRDWETLYKEYEKNLARAKSTPKSTERIFAMYDYITALNEYNDAVTNVVRNAIGDSSFSSRGIGESFKQINAENKIDNFETKEGLPEAYKPEEVNGYKVVSSVVMANQQRIINNLPNNKKEAKITEYNNAHYGNQGARPSRNKAPILNAIARNNAIAQGRDAYKKAKESIINGPYDSAQDDYLLTAGFNAEIKRSEEGIPSIENSSVLFATLPTDGAYGFRDGLKRPDGKSRTKADMLKHLNWNALETNERMGYSKYILELHDRIDELKELINPMKMVSYFGGRQTLAGRQAILLETRINDLEAQLELHEEEIATYVEELEAGENPPINQKFGFSNMALLGVQNALENLNTDLRLAKAAYDQFRSPGWRRSVGQQVNQEYREQGLELPNYGRHDDVAPVNDINTISNYSFALKVLLSKQKKWGVDATMAYQMLRDYDRLNFSNEGEQLVQESIGFYKNARTYKINEDGLPTEFEELSEENIELAGNYLKNNLGDNLPVAQQNGFNIGSASGKEVINFIAKSAADQKGNGYNIFIPEKYTFFRVHSDGRVEIPKGMLSKDRFVGLTKKYMSDRMYADEIGLQPDFAARIIDRDATGRLIRPYMSGRTDNNPSEFEMLLAEKRRTSIEVARRKWFTRTAMIIGSTNTFGAVPGKEAVDKALNFLDLISNATRNNIDEVQYKTLAGLVGLDPDRAWKIRSQAKRNGMDGLKKFDINHYVGLEKLYNQYQEQYSGTLNYRSSDSVVKDSTRLTIDDDGRISDPHEVLANLVRFKAEMEMDYIERARVKSGDDVVMAMATIAADTNAGRDMVMVGDESASALKEQYASFVEEFKNSTGRDFFPRESREESKDIGRQMIDPEEAEAILDQMRIEARKSQGFPLYTLEGINETPFEIPLINDNPVAGTLIQALPGKVVVYAPQYPAKGPYGQVRQSIIPGKNGGPTVIYAPRKGASGPSNLLIATSLRLMADADPKVAELITDFGNEAFAKLAPINRLKRIALIHKLERENFIEAAKTTVNSLPNGVNIADGVKTSLILTLAKQFEGLMQQNDAAEAVSAINGLYDETKDSTASSILLISELLTDPNLKSLYDELSPETGPIHVFDHGMNSNQLQNIMNMVYSVSRSTLEGEAARAESYEMDNRDIEEVYAEFRDTDSEAMQEAIEEAKQHHAEEKERINRTQEELESLVNLTLNMVMDTGVSEYDSLDRQEQEEARMSEAMKDIKDFKGLGDFKNLFKSEDVSVTLDNINKYLDGKISAEGLNDMHRAMSHISKMRMRTIKNRVNALMIAAHHNKNEHGNVSPELHRILEQAAIDRGDTKLHQGDADLINFLSSVLNISKPAPVEAISAEMYKDTAVIQQLEMERWEKDPQTAEGMSMAPTLDSVGGSEYQVGSWHDLLKINPITKSSRISTAFANSRLNQISAGLLTLTDDGAELMDQLGIYYLNNPEAVQFDKNTWSPIYLPVNDNLMGQVADLLPNIPQYQDGESVDRIRYAAAEELDVLNYRIKQIKELDTKNAKLEEQIEEVQQKIAESALFEDIPVGYGDEVASLVDDVVRRLDEYIQRDGAIPRSVAKSVSQFMVELVKESEVQDQAAEINNLLSQVKRLATIVDNADPMDSVFHDAELNRLAEITNKKIESLEKNINSMITGVFKNILTGQIGLTEKGKEGKFVTIPRYSPEEVVLIAPGRVSRPERAALPIGQEIGRVIRRLVTNPSEKTYLDGIRSGLAGVASNAEFRAGFADVITQAVKLHGVKAEADIEGTGRGAAPVRDIGGAAKSKAAREHEILLRELRRRFRGQKDRTQARLAIRRLLETGTMNEEGDVSTKVESGAFTQIISNMMPSVEMRAKYANDVGITQAELVAKENALLEEKLNVERERERVDRAIRHAIVSNVSPVMMGYTQKPMLHKADDKAVVDGKAKAGDPINDERGFPVVARAKIVLTPSDFESQMPVLDFEAEENTWDAYQIEKIAEMQEAYREGREIDFTYAANAAAISRQLHEYADKEADEVYKLLKGDPEYIANFDANALALKTAKIVNLEQKMVDAQMERMKQRAEGLAVEPGVGHLGAEVLAEMTSPESGNQLISVSTAITREQAKLKKLESKLVATKKSFELAAREAKPTLTNKKQLTQLKAEKDKLSKELKDMESIVNEARKRLKAAKAEQARKEKVKRYTLPRNKEQRKKNIERIINVEGEFVVLAPVTMAEDLRHRYENSTRKKPTVNQYVLQALEPQLSSYAQALDPAKMPELTGVDAAGREMSRLEYSTAHLDAETEVDIEVWDGEKMVSTAGLSRREAGVVLEKSFIHGLRNWVVDPQGEAGANPRPVNTDAKTNGGMMVNAVENRFGHMVKVLLHSHNHENLTESTKKELDTWLKNHAATNAKDGRSSYFNNNISLNDSALDNIQAMNIIEMYSKVFAEIEGEYILDTLATGLYKNHDVFDFKIMKYLHHEDSRFRQRFLQDSIALSEAMRLRGILDRGFDQQSGRNGAQVQHMALAEKVEKSLRKVGNDAMDQSRAYMYASLQGILDYRYGKVSERLTQWIDTMEKGVADLNLLDKANKTAYSNPGSKFMSATHVDLMRDKKMVNDLAELFKPYIDKYDEGIEDATGLSEAKEARAIAIIKEMQAALLQGTAKSEEIADHAKFVNDMFSGLTDAFAMTKALMSQMDMKGVREDDAAQDDITLNKNSPFMSRASYSTVPLRLHYASNPNDNTLNQHVEGDEFQDDPLNIVRIEESSLFGGVGQRENKRGANPYRPINMNGASAIDTMLKDTLYRINVAPVYGVLRRSLGKELTSASGISMISPDARILKKVKAKHGDNWAKENKYQRSAMAAITAEIENVVRNDNALGVYNTQLSEALRFGSAQYIARALLTPLQFLYQTIGPIGGFFAKKLAIKQFAAMKNFGIIAPKLLTGMTINYARGKFAKDMDAQSPVDYADAQTFSEKATSWIKAADPWLSFRGTDGMDKYRNVQRRQRRYGVGFVKQKAGQAMKGLESLSEWGLDKVIGTGERWLSRSMYLTELLQELQTMKETGVINFAPRNVEELLSIPPQSIPTEAKDYARKKVNDMMGIADQAKKSLAFQSHHRKAGPAAIMRSLVRFSNHTATTSSNASGLLPALYPENWGTDNYAQKRMRQEAIENLVGTFVQNISFHFIKLMPFLNLTSYALFRLMGDDEDEAMEKSSEFANSLINPSEDMDSPYDFLRLYTVGSQSPFFKDWRDPESARRSAGATMTTKISAELIQAIPFYGIGALMGYTQLNDLAQRGFLNDLNESLWAIGEDIEVAPDNSRYEGVRIYRRDTPWHEALAGLTNPTAYYYDVVKNMGIAGKSLFLDDRDLLTTSVFLGSNIVGTREARSGMKRHLEDKIREEED